MRIGIALIISGIVIIILSLVETLAVLGMTKPDLWWTIPVHFSHQHYFALFGAGFLLVGIKLYRKKKD